MPKTEQQNQELRDARREQILRVATSIFARRGMAGTKISDIAKEAQLSHGLVYHYFSSKEEIFIELVRNAAASSIEVIHMANEQPGQAAEKMYWMTTQILQSLQGESRLLYLLMMQASTSEAVPVEVKAILKEHSPVMQTIPLIKEAQEDGEFRSEDPVTLATTYYAFIQGLAMNKIQWEDCPLPDADTILKVMR
ncbi:TetR/AcrR family transcriptional regulator [Sporosarcina sp. Te-1]|uniref:TetR/AcrR family transcriptional regulator n=1 Tax=Sporosarcina sp. Te-1 TaxID=2818390 RepID=UPI001A9E6ACC|nr:TetR/AcrR family transcriptional regulator [Sporosarcina sp. Te-1]QTD40524.1 TetR/AcrR family transcriptional regulator [Sporosarcina sp. Te-1]